MYPKLTKDSDAGTKKTRKKSRFSFFRLRSKSISSSTLTDFNRDNCSDGTIYPNVPEKETSISYKPQLFAQNNDSRPQKPSICRKLDCVDPSNSTSMVKQNMHSEEISNINMKNIKLNKFLDVTKKTDQAMVDVSVKSATELKRYEKIESHIALALKGDTDRQKKLKIQREESKRLRQQEREKQRQLRMKKRLGHRRSASISESDLFRKTEF